MSFVGSCRSCNQPPVVAASLAIWMQTFPERRKPAFPSDFTSLHLCGFAVVYAVVSFIVCDLLQRFNSFAGSACDLLRVCCEVRLRVESLALVF